MATNIFNARQLYRNAFINRQPSLDFTDDGTRFTMYAYKNTVPFHIARWKDMVFICIRIDYVNSLIPELPYINYSIYKDWSVYKLCDLYNGVYKDEVDLNNLFDSLEAVYKAIANYFNYPY